MATVVEPDPTEHIWRPREREAMRELGTTHYSRGVRTALTALFVAMIVAVPLYETIADVQANRAARERLIATGGDLSQFRGRRPRVLDALNLLPSWSAIYSARSLGALSNVLPKPQRLRLFEESLALNSGAGRMIRPWVQWVLTGWLGVGSQNVVLGRDGWLFYSDGVEYVAGRGFLEPRHFASKGAGGRHADPRPAILQLDAELKALGITLVVVPIPDKAVIRPTSFTRTLEQRGPVQNASWTAFVAEMQSRGVLLVDLTRDMFQAEQDGAPQFLRGDSHWSPAGANVAARSLADALVQRAGVQPGPPGTFSRRPVSVEHRNDLVALLDLPPARNQDRRYEQVTIDQVVGPDGRPAAGDTASELLLIGDSFTQIYSAEDNLAAGLAEQISYNLQRSVDRRTALGELNGRELLGETLQTLRQGVRGRRIVIWEFAARKLAVASWSLLPER